METIPEIADKTKASKYIKSDLAYFAKKHHAERSEDYQMHCHLFYEIYYFIEGDVDYMVEGKVYHPQKNSILLLKPGVAHGVKVKSNREYIRYAFHFMQDLIPVEHREILFSPFFEEKIYYENVNLIESFEQVLRCEELSKRVKDIAIMCRLESLLTEIYAMRRHLDEQDMNPHSAEKITYYINEHLTESINLDELASIFFISKSQLNRIFRKSMNITVGNYISLKRIHLARRFMLEGQSAEQAAISSGFKDYSTFYRTYKRIMGYAPTHTIDRRLFPSEEPEED